jgi:hypothetical protein
MVRTAWHASVVCEIASNSRFLTRLEKAAGSE